MYKDEITRISQEIYGKLIEIRRDIHMHPELACEEFRTTEKIYGYLKNIGINAVIAKEGTGVIGLIESCRPGKTVALRGDIDALPVQEEGSCEYKSVEAGKMHACGHDVNLTCILGAGEVLNRLKDKIKGNVKLIFQP
jgi:amidohydrolase